MVHKYILDTHALVWYPDVHRNELGELSGNALLMPDLLATRYSLQVFNLVNHVFRIQPGRSGTGRARRAPYLVTWLPLFQKQPIRHPRLHPV